VITFCGTTTPATHNKPTMECREWCNCVSGIIEVTTTNGPTAFKHTIVLKKVTLKSGKHLSIR
jgi:hypothetical protein